jgi:hypothetical protein
LRSISSDSVSLSMSIFIVFVNHASSAGMMIPNVTLRTAFLAHCENAKRMRLT